MHKNRMLCCIFTLCLCASLSTTALASGQTFSDVPEGRWYYTWVTKAAQAGWVSGVGGGKYESNKSVTYSQFAVMLDRALYADDMSAQPAGAYWWTPACEVADKHGLFVDTDMASRSDWAAVANKPIEREQMAQMMYNALVDVGAKLPSYEEYSEAVLNVNDIIDCDNYDAVATCYAIKLLSGNGNFDPYADMTRAQAAVVLCNIYGYVTGDVTGSEPDKPTEPETPVEPDEPTQPDVPRPAGAVGGRYDTSVYNVPADSNKDGWITEAEVQAVLNQLREEYPDGSEWGLHTRYPGRPDGKGMGAGSACQGFANMVSDRIFGSLPKYEVKMENSRVGDYSYNNGHSLTLQTVNWQTEGDGHFTAIASYSGSATSSYVKGYTVTADYAGTVSRINLNKIRYVAIFEGTALEPAPTEEPGDTSSPEPTDPTAPTEPTDPTDTPTGEKNSVLPVVAVVVVVLLGGGVFYFIKRR